MRALQKEADAAQVKAAELQAQAESSLAAAGAARDKLVKNLSAIADQLRNREDIVLGLRKFQSAKLDAAKANVDIAVRDNFNAEKMKEVQDKVERETDAFKALNLRYQVRNVARVQLQTVITEITAAQTNAQKAQEAALADLGRLEQQFAERQTNLFRWTVSISREKNPDIADFKCFWFST